MKDKKDYKLNKKESEMNKYNNNWKKREKIEKKMKLGLLVAV